MTRRIWTTGSALIIVFAGASLAWAEPANIQAGRTTSARSDIARHIQAVRPAKEHNSAIAPFLSGPACEVPESSSGQHLSWVPTRTQAGLIGGSYGEVFFASGAGSRVVAQSSANVAAEAAASAGSSPAAPSPNQSVTPSTPSGGGTTAAPSASGSLAGLDAQKIAAALAAGNLTEAQVAALQLQQPPSQQQPPSPQQVPPQAAVNPEPATLVLLGTGLTAVLFSERRRRSKK